jgi:Kef-type K+ transport system membrane component KefB
MILFMFIVGMELNLDSLRHQAHSATFISHAGILVPFALGARFCHDGADGLDHHHYGRANLIRFKSLAQPT